jgi:membrane protein YqaA with SNARE-associated domain
VKALKHFLVRYKAWIMGLLAPLGGIWAVLIIAFVDASFFGIPVDPVVAYYIAQRPGRLLIYALLAAVGSAVGGTIPYLIGYLGGEAVVEKRLGPDRFARMHFLSEKYGTWALVIPSLMPPGFPFKAFQLIAGVTEMRYPHYMLAVFAGRLLRFLALGILIVAFGPEILSFLGTEFHHHRVLSLIVTAIVIVLIVYLVRVINARHLAHFEAHQRQQQQNAASGSVENCEKTQINQRD